MTKTWFQEQVAEIRAHDENAVIAVCQQEAPKSEPFEEWLHEDQTWSGQIMKEEWGVLEAVKENTTGWLPFKQGFMQGPNYIYGCTKVNVCGYIRLTILGPQTGHELKFMRSERKYKKGIIPQLKGGVIAALRVANSPPVAIVCTHAPTKRRKQPKFYSKIMRHIPQITKGWKLGAVIISGDLNHRLAMVDAPNKNDMSECKPLPVHAKCAQFESDLVTLQTELCRLLTLQQVAENNAKKSSWRSKLFGKKDDDDDDDDDDEEEEEDADDDDTEPNEGKMDIRLAQAKTAELLSHPEGRECMIQYDALDGDAGNFKPETALGPSDPAKYGKVAAVNGKSSSWSSWSCKTADMHEHFPGYSLETENAENAKACWTFAKGETADVADMVRCFDTMGEKQAKKSAKKNKADGSSGGFMKDRALSIGWLDRTCEAHDNELVSLTRSYELLDHSSQQKGFVGGSGSDDSTFLHAHHSDHTIVITDTVIEYLNDDAARQNTAQSNFDPMKAGRSAMIMPMAGNMLDVAPPNSAYAAAVLLAVGL